jgi:hypothetical protein
MRRRCSDGAGPRVGDVLEYSCCCGCEALAFGFNGLGRALRTCYSWCTVHT